MLEQVLPRRAAAALEEATGARELLTSLARSGELPDEADVEDLLARGLLLRVQGRTYLPAEVEPLMAEVEAVCPDYATSRAWLRAEGLALC